MIIEQFYEDLGRQNMASALKEISEFKLGLVETVAGPARRNGNGYSKKPPREVMEMVKYLSLEIIEQTQLFLERCDLNGIGYEGFCRYLMEGANNTYAAQGINEEVLRFLLPFKAFDDLKGIDFCFGHAEITRTLSRMGARMRALDLNPFFVHRAREMGLDAQIAKVDVPVKEFSSGCGIDEGSYDFALTTLSLDRIEKPRNFLENIFFTLRDEGCFAIQTLLPIVPIDDGDTENPIVYTLAQDRITSGENVEADKSAFAALLYQLGATRMRICQLPYVVASGDGVQTYVVWSFFGQRKTRRS